MRRITRVALIVAVLCLLITPVLAFAEGANYEDISGNYFTCDDSASNKSVTLDLYGAGQKVTVNGTTVGESALLAGQYVKLLNSTLGGSLRAAGYDIAVDNSQIDCNAAIAGYSISFGANSSAQAVFTAGMKVDFGGTCNTLYASAREVVISGTINGDADIFADKVTIKDTAVIKGKLNVSASEEPALASGAAVGGVNFKKIESSDATADAVVGAVKTVGFISKLGSLIVSIPSGILLSLVFYLIIRKQIKEASEMVTKRPVAMPISGLIALIATPIAAIIMFVTVIGALTGGLVTIMFVSILIFATVFAGCAGGQLLFPKLHPIVAYIIGVAIVRVACIIPVLGVIVTLVCMVYTLGYFIQKIYLGFPRKDRTANNAETAPAALPDNSEKI